jgi:hypothetical protein
MANSRFYSSVAQQTTLTGGVTSSGTSIAVASTAGFPGSLPFTLALDYGSSNEELVEVTAVASLTLTVTRAIDGTSGSAHSAGAFVRHVSSARDFTDSRTHEAASTNVHGLSGGAAVVGTTQSQTLTNKTLTRAVGSLQNITMFNTGASGITQIIGDSTNPNASRFEIKDNESALNTMVFVRANGNLALVKNAADVDSTYRIRMTESDQTTDRFVVLAGGTVTVAPTAATGFVAMDIVAPDTSTSKRAIRLAAPGGGTERFTVWNDGHVDIMGTSTAFSTFDITGPASHASAYFRIMDSGLNNLVSVGSSGNFIANRGALVAQPGTLSGAVLQVGGSNAGYTGNLEQWVGPANTVVASINEVGNLSTSGFVSAGFATSTVITGTSDATNFTTNFFQFKTSAAVCSVILEMTRSGATFTPADTNGNVTPDLLVTTLPVGSRPPRTIYGACTTAIGEGMFRYEAGGDVYLVTWTSSPATITSGSIIRGTIQWIL